MKGIKIVIVDDDHAMGGMMCEFLTVFGATIHLFSNPIEALKFFSQHSAEIDLVITDQRMPELTGTEMAVQMLKIKPALPIILCTGYCPHTTAESSAKLGISVFLTKPVNMGNLVARINTLVQPKLNIGSKSV